MNIDVKHVAKLARLRIDEKDVAEFETQMNDILGMVEKLPPLESKEALIDTNITMQLRKDEIEPSFKREDMLKNAHETAAGCIVVPKTV